MTNSQKFNKLKVGDKLVCIKTNLNSLRIKGKKYTIVNTWNDGTENEVYCKLGKYAQTRVYPEDINSYFKYDEKRIII